MGQVAAADRFPLVARIRGNNEREGVEIHRAAGIATEPDHRASARAEDAAAGGRP